jgi:hypothetical protein
VCVLLQRAKRRLPIWKAANEADGKLTLFISFPFLLVDISIHLPVRYEDEHDPLLQLRVLNCKPRLRNLSRMRVCFATAVLLLAVLTGASEVLPAAIDVDPSQYWYVEVSN